MTKTAEKFEDNFVSEFFKNFLKELGLKERVENGRSVIICKRMIAFSLLLPDVKDRSESFFNWAIILLNNKKDANKLTINVTKYVQSYIIKNYIQKNIRNIFDQLHIKKNRRKYKMEFIENFKKHSDGIVGYDLSEYAKPFRLALMALVMSAKPHHDGETKRMLIMMKYVGDFERFAKNQ